jgi:hypothetical protein
MDGGLYGQRGVGVRSLILTQGTLRMNRDHGGENVASWKSETVEPRMRRKALGKEQGNRFLDLSTVKLISAVRSVTTGRSVGSGDGGNLGGRHRLYLGDEVPNTAQLVFGWISRHRSRPANCSNIRSVATDTV